jgi:hypothetical protein
MMEAKRSSETSVLTRATMSTIQENGILHSHRRENRKSYKGIGKCRRIFVGRPRLRKRYFATDDDEKAWEEGST